MFTAAALPDTGTGKISTPVAGVVLAAAAAAGFILFRVILKRAREKKEREEQQMFRRMRVHDAKNIFKGLGNVPTAKYLLDWMEGRALDKLPRISISNMPSSS